MTEVWAENSLAGQQERVFRATDGVVRTPSVVIGAADVVAEATRMLTGIATTTRPARPRVYA